MSNDEFANELRPVAARERIESLDVLRGVAILAVLLAFAVWNLGSPPLETYGTAGRALEFVLSTLVDTKAYTLLAFLFGVGFAIQMQRASDLGESAVPIYCRRLFALIAIGLAHALLLRNGDILVPYAAMGFVMLLFRNASNRSLIAGIVISAFLTYAARYLWELSGVPFPQRPDTTGLGHIESNLLWVKYWYTTAITNWPGSLPMLLAGFYVGRKRFFEHVDDRISTLRRIAIGGAVLGILMFATRLALIQTLEPDPSPASVTNLAFRLMWSAHAWGLAAFYASTTLLLLRRATIRRLLSPIAAVGRMSLTNYLLQAIILIPVCIAFNLYDTIKPSFGLVLTFLVALFQIPFSVLWLRYFRFGPAEWLWRSITYLKPQPMFREKLDGVVRDAVSIGG